MEHFMVKDGQYLAVFQSTHKVLKAEGILKSLSLPIMLIPAPRALKSDCGLALRFDENEFDKVISTLISNELPPAFVCRLISGEYIKQELENR
jgi:Protein of unknown function (DUF3343)